MGGGNLHNPPMPDLRAIGWPYPDTVGDPAWAALCAEFPQARPARIVEQHRSGYLVAEAPGEAVAVESLPEWQRPGGYRKGQTTPDARPGVGEIAAPAVRGRLRALRRRRVLRSRLRWSGAGRDPTRREGSEDDALAEDYRVRSEAHDQGRSSVAIAEQGNSTSE